MPSKDCRQQVKQLLRDTMVRYPNQPFPPEFQSATLEDWLERVDRVGFARFEAGVKRARSYEEFFPHVSKIDALIPERAGSSGEDWNAELKELIAQKKAGVKFYTIQDVFTEVAHRITDGRIKPRNPTWFEWAAKFIKRA